MKIGVMVGRQLVGDVIEALKNEDGEPIVFLDKQAAEDWLFLQGYNEQFIKSLCYKEVEK